MGRRSRTARAARRGLPSAVCCRTRGALSSAERALTGKAITDEAIAAAAAQVVADLGNDVSGDIYASAEYRTAMAPVFTKRALANAAARALLT